MVGLKIEPLVQGTVLAFEVTAGRVLPPFTAGLKAAVFRDGMWDSTGGYPSRDWRGAGFTEFDGSDGAWTGTGFDGCEWQPVVGNNPLFVPPEPAGFPSDSEAEFVWATSAVREERAYFWRKVGEICANTQTGNHIVWLTGDAENKRLFVNGVQYVGSGEEQTVRVVHADLAEGDAVAFSVTAVNAGATPSGLRAAIFRNGQWLVTSTANSLKWRTARTSAFGTNPNDRTWLSDAQDICAAPWSATVEVDTPTTGRAYDTFPADAADAKHI